MNFLTTVAILLEKTGRAEIPRVTLTVKISEVFPDSYIME
jgi:hypothetical protein